MGPAEWAATIFSLESREDLPRVSCLSETRTGRAQDVSLARWVAIAPAASRVFDRRVNVDSLRNVSRFLDIYGPAVGAEREDTGKPLQLTFPSLVYAYRLLVEGRISKDPGIIQLPELEKPDRNLFSLWADQKAPPRR
ncbi:unnamed protein product [Aspergillus oryzae RIB40]|uniref:DNA, SC005 n=2 Tax=Aspergillus oryzae TaxID=5062 RepID=Q2USC1_ASPOR|nr:unnamed protein product [Aspergillus oryzae RIB40]EIT82278.1 hypothetical protein Ao3042_00581 [Aspergillus oryzae 3.042]KDE76986.1 hypothetical protein AO1008_02692 [Aspergillus oryzae 100-8]BAE55544.1 unnamed protein product [Aspergillus oryzae RIB40]|eukprot:EIT82278.1 hypothetical protein Ao3042_00581 [Aspergillus oryzae 3.042]